MISNSETKFDETTVTRQSISPSVPTMIVPAAAQQISGMAMKRILRKIRPRATMMRTSTAMLKLLRSPRTKEIRSSAIIGAPLRWIRAPSR